MTMALVPRRAVMMDADLLGEMNRRLIQDEGHRNAMTIPELQQRMRDWLAGEYQAFLFENAGCAVAYALFCEEPSHVYLRQFFVERDHRRQGFGGEAIRILRNQFWPIGKRLTVDVLSANQGGIAFWKKIGYREYAVTLEIVPEGS